MHAAYTWLIADALDAAGIEIPFPQTDLRIRSILGREGDEAAEMLGLKRPSAPPAGPTPPAPEAGANDAAEELLNPADDPEGEARGG